jgi:hypothetical protein
MVESDVYETKKSFINATRFCKEKPPYNLRINQLCVNNVNHIFNYTTPRPLLSKYLCIDKKIHIQHEL